MQLLATWARSSTWRLRGGPNTRPRSQAGRPPRRDVDASFDPCVPDVALMDVLAPLSAWRWVPLCNVVERQIGGPGRRW